MSAAVVAAGIWVAVPQSGQADSPRAGCAGDPRRSDLAQGEGTIAISNREVVVIGSKRSGCMYARTASRDGLLKHVASTRDVGTAYVDDRVGGDTLVAVTPEGVERIAIDGEITHPAWSEDGEVAFAVDFTSLRVMDPAGDSEQVIQPPGSTVGVFSPVFTDEGIATVAQEPGRMTGLAEDETLDNIYRLDDRTGDWTRLTDFTVSGDRWSAIRTPVVTERGDILFVRVSGNYLATKAPHFELWMHSDGATKRLRKLPGEMYLAGMRNGHLMWNVYSRTCGDWELLVEDPSSGLKHLGCGAVFVDPVNIPDGDLAVEDAEERHAHETAERSAPEVAVTTGVVVGDFSTRAEAAAVAARIGGMVITARKAPAAIRPGVFAAAVSVTGDTDETLRAVKKAVPELKGMVFLAPLGKLGS